MQFVADIWPSPLRANGVLYETLPQYPNMAVVAVVIVEMLIVADGVVFYAAVSCLFVRLTSEFGLRPEFL
jgi:hypothetical protein